KESETLLEEGNLELLRRFLDDEGLYVFTLNGFPFGRFHGEPIKSAVFAPDWRSAERTDYTLRLVEILRRLLPPGVEGGISTVPLSYRRWIREKDPAEWKAITAQLVRVAGRLVEIEREEGIRIHLDIEPEPDGLVERSAEVVAFFERWLFPFGGPLLARSLGLPEEAARRMLTDHLRVCLDSCHLAVMYESPEAALARYAKAGIRIGKVQISAAMEVIFPEEHGERRKLQDRLWPFAESTYLHQVVERSETGAFRRYSDLERRLAEIQPPDAGAWRIHFHLPLFVASYGFFRSTQGEARALLKLLQEQEITSHLEIETYTWEVLPKELKAELTDSIEREYRWVLDALDGADSAGHPLVQEAGADGRKAP
ncbi:MAG TPA: metabolite traffic protein EboE, partial [Candidatus Manganitrophaceae bacterium]|nr:metabolite traffic protein EboE [Candidatus Manganitrophaceae bacterium]